jgi:hypothetical protein
MSIKSLPIYNSNNFSSPTLTLEQAKALFYQKSAPTLIVQGNETVQNETVYGNVSTSTLTASNSCVLGNTTSNHSINGNIALTALPALTSTVTPSNDLQLATKKYVDTTAASNNLLTSSNTWSGINTFNNDLIRQYCFSATASGFNFSCQPQVSSSAYQTTSGSSANALTTKSYVDSKTVVQPAANKLIISGAVTKDGSNNYVLPSKFTTLFFPISFTNTSNFQVVSMMIKADMNLISSAALSTSTSAIPISGLYQNSASTGIYSIIYDVQSFQGKIQAISTTGDMTAVTYYYFNSSKSTSTAFTPMRFENYTTSTTSPNNTATQFYLSFNLPSFTTSVTSSGWLSSYTYGLEILSSNVDTGPSTQTLTTPAATSSANMSFSGSSHF